MATQENVMFGGTYLWPFSYVAPRDVLDRDGAVVEESEPGVDDAESSAPDLRTVLVVALEDVRIVC